MGLCALGPRAGPFVFSSLAHKGPGQIPRGPRPVAPGHLPIQGTMEVSEALINSRFISRPVVPPARKHRIEVCSPPRPGLFFLYTGVIYLTHLWRSEQVICPGCHHTVGLLLAPCWCRLSNVLGHASLARTQYKKPSQKRPLVCVNVVTAGMKLGDGAMWLASDSVYLTRGHNHESES